MRCSHDLNAILQEAYVQLPFERSFLAFTFTEPSLEPLLRLPPPPLVSPKTKTFLSYIEGRSPLPFGHPPPTKVINSRRRTSSHHTKGQPRHAHPQSQQKNRGQGGRPDNTLLIRKYLHRRPRPYRRCLQSHLRRWMPDSSHLFPD